MYYWFKPSGAGSCSLNVGLITVTLLLVVSFSLLSLAPLAKGVSTDGLLKYLLVSVPAWHHTKKEFLREKPQLRESHKYA